MCVIGLSGCGGIVKSYYNGPIERGTCITLGRDTFQRITETHVAPITQQKEKNQDQEQKVQSFQVDEMAIYS